ncbi:MAG: glycosyltransferase family 4 protein [Candidatus Kerfeldbacteria bacterium]|nr:glycosyltransferase family 4 protein [Candidatus Kerfeldbacteria bacterium]
MKPIRVAFVNELYGTRRQGGEQEAMFALASRLNLEPDVQTETFTYSGKDSNRLAFRAPEMLRLFPYVRDITVVPRLGRFIAKTITPNFDLIHTCATTMFAERVPPVPVVTSLHAIRLHMAENVARIPKYWPVVNPLIRARIRTLEKRSLLRAQKLVVLKQSMADFLRDRYGIPASQISIVPNPVDTALFSPKPSKEPIVLFVGRASVMKGIDILLKAAPMIHGKVIVATRVVELGLQKRFHEAKIELHKNVEHAKMADLYQSAQVFVLPSRDECQPLSVLEAMASGIPSVVTPAAASNLIEDQRHGIIVSNDPDRLAHAVNTLLANEKLRTEYGARAREKLEKQHAWPLIIHAYKKIYEEALTFARVSS